MHSCSRAPTVGIVIVNYNSNSYLQRALDSLVIQTRRPDRVIVVDNGSAPPPNVKPWESLLPIQMHSLERNLGFAVANNIGIRCLEGLDWVALLNPDAYPEAQWLEVLLASAEAHPEFAFFACRQLDASDPTLLDGAGDRCDVCGFPSRRGNGRPAAGLYEKPEEIFGPCAAAAVYRRSALMEVDGFDEDFFCYYEDVDLAFRLRLAGYRCMYVPDAVVLHVGSAVTGKTSEFTIFYCQRNIEWLYIKNMPAKWFWKYFPLHIARSIGFLMRSCVAGQPLAALRAKLHALKGTPRMLHKRKRVFARCENPSVASLRLDGIWHKQT